MNSLIHKILAAPLAISAEGLATLPSLAAGVGSKNGRVDESLLSIEGDVGVLNIVGILLPSATLFEQMLGAVGCDQIHDALTKARSKGVKTLFVNFDTPGGSSRAIPELAVEIKNFPGRKIAFTSGAMASAGYWLGSSCGKVIATPSASVGSVGVFNALIDSSGAFADAGLKTEVFRSGVLKAIGLDGTSLSDEQKAHLQDQVGQMFAMFKTHVSGMRRGISEEVWKGHSVFGPQAVTLGLVDVLVNSADEALAMAGVSSSTEPPLSTDGPKADVSESALRAVWAKDKNLRDEFGDDFACYQSYVQMEKSGRFRNRTVAPVTPLAGQDNSEAALKGRWQLSAELRREFGDDYKTFSAYVEMERTGRVRI